MSFRAPLLNFSKGEISEALQGRFDVGAYNAGLRRARNVVLKKTGGVRSRPGFRFVAELVNTDTPGRIIPFEYSYEQSYALVMEQGIMRPAAFGGMIVEEDFKITGATNDTRIRITQPFHGYTAGDEIFFSGIVGMTELNGVVAKVDVVIDADNYQIDVDGSTFGTFISSGGTLATGAPPAPPTPPVVPPVADPPDPAPVIPPSSNPDNSGTVDGGGGQIVYPPSGGTGAEQIP